MIPDYSRAEAIDYLDTHALEAVPLSFVDKVEAYGFAGPKALAAMRAYENDTYVRKEETQAS